MHQNSNGQNAYRHGIVLRSQSNSVTSTDRFQPENKNPQSVRDWSRLSDAITPTITIAYSISTKKKNSTGFYNSKLTISIEKGIRKLFSCLLCRMVLEEGFFVRTRVTLVKGISVTLHRWPLHAQRASFREKPANVHLRSLSSFVAGKEMHEHIFNAHTLHLPWRYECRWWLCSPGTSWRRWRNPWWLWWGWAVCCWPDSPPWCGRGKTAPLPR